MKTLKVTKQYSPDIDFWAAQILWFLFMLLIAVIVIAYWWDWGMRWINAGGTIIVPVVALAIITTEMLAIIYFKTTVPDDEGGK